LLREYVRWICAGLPPNNDTAAALLAVLRGSAVNQDGRSSALTAPRGPAQQAVLWAALTAGGVAAEDVTSLQVSTDSCRMLLCCAQGS